MENLEKYIGKKLSELPKVIDGYYPIIDDDDEVLSFIDLNGCIVMQGDLMRKIKNLNGKDSFEFDKKREVYID